MGTGDGGNAVFCRVGAARWVRLENRTPKLHISAHTEKGYFVYF
jgi:hypothetical protein